MDWPATSVATPGPSRELISEEEFLANAAFIVTACNNHAALVAMLEHVALLGLNADIRDDIEALLLEVRGE